MKSYSDSYRGALMGTVLACLLFVGGYPAAGKSLPTDRASASTQRAGNPAQLIIRRIPNLGNNVIVDVYLDGQPFAAIGYGHTFEGPLPTGEHVLSVEAAPSPTWPTRQGVVINAQSGQTYAFTALDDNSGSLMLQPNER